MPKRIDPRSSRTRRAWWRHRPAEALAGGFALLALLAFVGVRVASSLPSDGSSRVSTEVLAAGEALYQNGCAACHGSEGEGSAQPTIPAPPLDGSAHSWHHSDAQIVGLIRQGGTQMPAVGASWNDDEVEAVLSFVKSRWAPWQREQQPGTIGE